LPVVQCTACIAWVAMDLPLEGSNHTLGIAQPGHLRIAQDVGCPAMGVSQLSNVGIWRKVANRFGYVQQAVHTGKPWQQPYDASYAVRHVHHRIPRVELGLLEPGFVRFGRLQRLQCPLGGARGLHLVVQVWEPVPRACWWAGCMGGRDIPRPIFHGESEFRTGADWFQAPASPQAPTCTLPACKVRGGWAGGMHLHVPRWLEWGGTAPTLMAWCNEAVGAAKAAAAGTWACWATPLN
jgi:hypothetical protein